MSRVQLGSSQSPADFLPGPVDECWENRSVGAVQWPQDPPSLEPTRLKKEPLGGNALCRR